MLSLETIKKMNKQELRTLIKENVKSGNEVIVKFTKVNGDIRELNISADTFQPIIKSENDAEDKPQRKQNDSVLSVIDKESGEWRSFKLDAIVELKINQGA